MFRWWRKYEADKKQAEYLTKVPSFGCPPLHSFLRQQAELTIHMPCHSPSLWRLILPLLLRQQAEPCHAHSCPATANVHEG